MPNVLPGETVRIDFGKDVHASLVEVLTSAPERVAAPCQLFTICGGCHYQHAPYEYQLARKVEILREQLQRVGKIKFEGEISVISGPPLGIATGRSFISLTARSDIWRRARMSWSQWRASVRFLRRD